MSLVLSTLLQTRGFPLSRLKNMTSCVCIYPSHIYMVVLFSTYKKKKQNHFRNALRCGCIGSRSRQEHNGVPSAPHARPRLLLPVFVSTAICDTCHPERHGMTARFRCTGYASLCTPLERKGRFKAQREGSFGCDTEKN